jgi:hypothetical protein
VRWPHKAAPIPPAEIWRRAVAAVGQAWSAEGATPTAVLAGDAVPERLGATPPGVVLSSPDSPVLAGAVALAAGRFQPLLRWETPKRFTDVLSADEARALARELEERVADRLPKYGKLGDDCDFLTLAGDWPYRYVDQYGQSAFDDLLGRGHDRRRWAFTGRLLGDGAAGVYRAMCSLFLQPRSALLLNAYDEQAKDRVSYSMKPAAAILRRWIPVVERSGEQASLAGWHQAFDPVNRCGLVLINSSGGATSLNLVGGPGHTADTPPSEPAAVVMIHSFSAADPTDPQTLAGRWLANGAYVYFGALNEPFLQSFRAPELITALLAEGVPLAAALRQAPPEPFHGPWRLVYLGDPLYRLDRSARPPPRREQWEVAASWPGYVEYREPEAGAPDDDRLSWALKTAIVLTQRGARPRQRVDLPTTLLTIRRDRLSPPSRPLYDALLADVLLEAGRRGELEARLAQLPPSERSPVAGRQLEACRAASLQWLVAARDFPKAAALWSQIIRSPSPTDFVEQATGKVGALADSPTRLTQWRAALRAVRRDGETTPHQAIVDAALKRVDEKLASNPSQHR